MHVNERQVNGVQAHVKRLYPIAVYMHCASHILNLVISKAYSAADIVNCMSTIKDVITSGRSSAKHVKALQQRIEVNASALKTMSVSALLYN